MAYVDFESGVLRLVRTGSDLTSRQIGVMLRCRDEQRTVRFLAEDLNISKPAISRAVDKLVEADYMRRKTDIDDRRSVFVSLSPAGRKFVEKLLVAV